MSRSWRLCGPGWAGVCGLCAAFALFAPTCKALAQAPAGKADRSRPGREEQARRKLLEQMGLEKKEPAPPAPAPTPAPAPPAAALPSSPPAPVAPVDGPGQDKAGASAPRPASAVVFAGAVHEALLGPCRSCHNPTGVAAATRLVLTGEATHDHAAACALVDLGNPAASLLLGKATATVAHAGGPTVAVGSAWHGRMLKWIAGGARLDARAAGAAAAGPGDNVAGLAPAQAPGTAGRPRARAALAVPGAAPPIAMPLADAADDAAALPPGAAAALPPGAAAALPPGDISTRASGDAAALPLPPGDVATPFHQGLVRACLPCHRAGGPAAMTHLLFDGRREADLIAAAGFVDARHGPSSPLALKAGGLAHAGGPIWPPGSAGAAALAAWLAAGAPTAPPAAGAPTAPPAAAAADAGLSPPSPAALPSPPPSPAAPDATSAASPRMALLGRAFTLNGRFDLDLERRGFEANPFGGGSTAITSYHHFVFLGRQSAEDPFTFTAEITSLLFYEAGLRLLPSRRGFGLHVRAGKLLVPFGNEPLFHQSYGGLVGFDQKVLPAVWASEGLAASGHLDLGCLSLTGDLYGVRGHALRRPDDVLNLQNDLSPPDDARPAAGLRLGAAWGALAGFYSAYFNPLGQDRRLFLQALDLSLWRWRRAPVLAPLVGRLVLGVGFLRADVSGGGAGSDYYHFASYWLARIYPWEWLHLQYRQGLRTFGNRRGLIFDPRHSGPEDASAHNFAVVARMRGLSISLSYFLNLEKANEVDDDLLRLAVAYEF